MRKHSQAILTASKKTAKSGGWDRAIAEAERQIAEHEARINKLRLAIGTFRDMQKRAEPFMPDLQGKSQAA